MKLSVVIITRNQSEQTLLRTLEALKIQNYALSDWELIIIDNNDVAVVGDTQDLTWHPHVKIIHESIPGAAQARYRGAVESSGDFVIQVDDDNVLEPDYFREGLVIGDKHPFLGAWGAGIITPEFEIPLPDYYRSYISLLAIVDEEEARWSNIRNLPFKFNCMPNGAGMFMRKNTLKDWANSYKIDKQKQRFLGRRKGIHNYALSEEVDMILHCSKFDLGWGIFPNLRLLHIINKERLTYEYLLKSIEGNAYSAIIMNYLYFKGKNINTKNTQSKLSKSLDYLGRLGNEIRHIRNAIQIASKYYVHKNNKIDAAITRGHELARNDIKTYLK